MEKKEKDLTKSQIKELSKQLSDEVLKFQKALFKLERDINMMQNGDGVTPYWNGKSACDWGGYLIQLFIGNQEYSAI